MHEKRIQLMVDLIYSIKNLLRRLQSRIADTEIINVFFAVYFSHSFAFLKHCPYLGTAGEERLHCF